MTEDHARIIYALVVAQRQPVAEFLPLQADYSEADLQAIISACHSLLPKVADLRETTTYTQAANTITAATDPRTGRSVVVVTTTVDEARTADLVAEVLKLPHDETSELTRRLYSLVSKFNRKLPLSYETKIKRVGPLCFLNRCRTTWKA